MSKVSKIINTSKHEFMLESGIILGAYGGEYNVRQNVELTDRERERLGRWCVILDIGDEWVGPELQFTIDALIREEEERMYRERVEADCYWSDQTVSAEIHDFVGEDRERPRLLVTSSPDYSGGSKQFTVDVIASIKHDWNNIACPLIGSVVKHWQSYVRLFSHAEWHRGGREKCNIAKKLLSKTVPTALETAKEQALPKEIAFERLLNFDTLGGRLGIGGFDVGEELLVLRFAFSFITEAEEFRAVSSNDWRRKACRLFETLEQDFKARLDEEIKSLPFMVERFNEAKQDHNYEARRKTGTAYKEPPTEEKLRQRYLLVDGKVLAFFKHDLELYLKEDNLKCLLVHLPKTYENLRSHYLSWRLRPLGITKPDTVENYFRDARRLHKQNRDWNDIRLNRFDATHLAETFSLKQRVPNVHHAGKELHFQFEEGRHDRTTLLLTFNPRMK